MLSTGSTKEDLSQHYVFNLGNFKGGHFHLISDENKTLPMFPHSLNVKDGPL